MVSSFSRRETGILRDGSDGGYGWMLTQLNLRTVPAMR